MKNYNPNIYNGIHKVKITLQQWGYVGHIIQSIGGNCRGRDILDFDFECEDAFPDNDCELTYHEEDDFFSAVLKDENGNTLEVEGDEYEMNSMIVAMEIIDYSEREVEHGINK